MQSVAPSPSTKDSIVTLKLLPNVLRNIDTSKPLSTKKKTRSVPRKNGVSRRQKLGRPQKSSLEPLRKKVRRRPGDAERRRKLKREIEIARAHQESEKYLIKKNAAKWATFEPEDNPELDWLEVQVTPNTVGIPVLIRRPPHGLPDAAISGIARTQYMTQAVGHKLGIPPPNANSSPLLHRLINADSMERIEAAISRQKLPLQPATPTSETSLMMPTMYGKLQDRERAQVQAVLDAGQQVFPSVSPPRYGAPSYAMQPVRPPRTGQYDINDPSYHYAANIRDNTLAPNPLRSRDPKVQVDLSMVALKNLHQYNANHIEHDLFMSGGLAADDLPYQDSEENQTAIAALQEPNARNSEFIINVDDKDFNNGATNAKDTRWIIRHCTTSLFPPVCLLSRIRDTAVAVHNSRRGRARICSVVAQHCAHEVRWREESRGRFIVDDDLNGGYQQNAVAVNPQDIHVRHPDMHFQNMGPENTIPQDMNYQNTNQEKLGYRRQGIFNPQINAYELEEERPEDPKWRTAQEWREVLRTGGRDLTEDERWRLGLMNDHHSVVDLTEDQVDMMMEGDRPWDISAIGGHGKMVFDGVVMNHMVGGVRGHLVRTPDWD
ncbi:hypothetical protein LTR05_006945 [Lithohypha guttulata]|uniref:Uncharacterized protein n=1 Tax=Lithohypha guttulata TaxID=1690604 RepID=A0AAN7YEX7_9EURO|nr:hypothetical protein LTR05_006945 [Lithohypha guttulata]